MCAAARPRIRGARSAFPRPARAVQRHGCLAEQRFEQLPLRRIGQPIRRLGPDPHHAEHVIRRGKRHVHGFGRRQCLGPPAGRFAVFEHPLRDAKVSSSPRLRWNLCHHIELPVAIRQHEHDRAAEEVVEVAQRDSAQFRAGSRGSQVSAYGVQGRRPALAKARDAGLLTHPGREPAHDQRHDQHHHEGEEVSHVGHGEGAVGPHEHDVEAGHGQQARQHRGPPPIARRHHDDRQQVEHGGVDLGQRPVKRQRDRRHQAHDHRRAEVVADGGYGEPGLGTWLMPDIPVVVRADPDMHPLRTPHQSSRHGCRKQTPQPPAPRPPDHDPGHVVRARVGKNLLGGVMARHRHSGTTQFLGQAKRFLRRLAVAGRHGGVPRQFYVERRPRRAEHSGQSARTPHQPETPFGRRHAYQEAFGGRPRLGDAGRRAIAAHLLVHPLRGAAERELAKRNQIAASEEAVQRPLRLLREVHLPLAEPLFAAPPASRPPVRFRRPRPARRPVRSRAR